jgi:hypothetical protein
MPRSSLHALASKKSEKKRSGKLGVSSATLGAVRILRGEEVVAYLPTIVSNSNAPLTDASSNEPKARWDLLNELEKALVITATTANGWVFTLT